MLNEEITDINHFNDNLAKALLKYKDIPLHLAQYALSQIGDDQNIIKLNLVDAEVKNYKDAKKTIMDVLVEFNNSTKKYKMDVEVQSYRAESLVVRMHNYAKALGTNDYINCSDKTSMLPTNIQLWLFKHENCASEIKFNGRKLVVLDLMDTETFERYSFGDKYILVNADYYASLKDFRPNNDFDAIMRFFVLSDKKEIEDFVTENNFKSLNNLLKRQNIFFGDDKEVRAYMDREFELKEKEADKKTIATQAKALQKAEAEAKAQADARKKAEADAKAQADARKKAEDENAKLRAILAQNGIDISSD